MINGSPSLNKTRRELLAAMFEGPKSYGAYFQTQQWRPNPFPSRSVARRRRLTLAPLTVTGFAATLVVRGNDTSSAPL